MSPAVLFCVAVGLLSLSLAYGNEETRLMSELLQGYPKDGGRPVENTTDVMDVKLKLMLLHIHSLDQEKKVFTISAWLMQTWSDSMLKWDPSEYGGVNYVLMDLTKIWRPDVSLFNALEPSIPLQPVMAHVTSAGAITTVEPYKYVSQCPDVTPDDNTPTCPLKFGSWAYDTSRLKTSSLTEDAKVDISYFQTSTEYELLGSLVEVKEKIYPCCPGTVYGHVEFTIDLKKRNKKPEKDPNDSSATTSVAMATTVAAMLALQVAVIPLM